MKEIEMFLLINMDSPLDRDRCKRLIEQYSNQRVIEELDRMATKIEVDISEGIGDLKWRNERDKELKQNK